MYSQILVDGGIKTVQVFLSKTTIPFLAFTYLEWLEWTEIRITSRLDLVKDNDLAIRTIEYFLYNPPNEFTHMKPIDLVKTLEEMRIKHQY